MMDYSNKYRLVYLKSPDLFSEDLIQIFSAKTGKYIATIRQGDAMPDDDTDEPQLALPFEDQKDQLKLF